MTLFILTVEMEIAMEGDLKKYEMDVDEKRNVIGYGSYCNHGGVCQWYSLCC